MKIKKKIKKNCICWAFIKKEKKFFLKLWAKLNLQYIKKYSLIIMLRLLNLYHYWVFIDGKNSIFLKLLSILQFVTINPFLILIFIWFNVIFIIIKQWKLMSTMFWYIPLDFNQSFINDSFTNYYWT